MNFKNLIADLFGVASASGGIKSIGDIGAFISLVSESVGSVNLALGAVGTITAIIAAIKGISDAIESAKFEKAEQLTEGFDDAKTSIDEYKVKVDELKTELENGIRDISDFLFRYIPFFYAYKARHQMRPILSGKI